MLGRSSPPSQAERYVPGLAASIPFSCGAKEILAYYDGDATRRVIDPMFDTTVDRLAALAKNKLTL